MASTSLSDDPDKLLNEWLGELENLIGVSFHFFNLSSRFHQSLFFK